MAIEKLRSGGLGGSPTKLPCKSPPTSMVPLSPAIQTLKRFNDLRITDKRVHGNTKSAVIVGQDEVFPGAFSRKLLSPKRRVSFLSLDEMT